MKATGQIVPNFHVDELKCRCGCDAAWISMAFLIKLQELREAVGEPLHVSSCCRCLEHNSNVGGVAQSFHLSTEKRDCRAIDIHCKTAVLRAKLVYYAQELGFNGIGIARTFIHLDTRSGERKIWSYKED